MWLRGGGITLAALSLPAAVSAMRESADGTIWPFAVPMAGALAGLRSLLPPRLARLLALAAAALLLGFVLADTPDASSAVRSTAALLVTLVLLVAGTGNALVERWCVLLGASALLSLLVIVASTQVGALTPPSALPPMQVLMLLVLAALWLFEATDGARRGSIPLPRISLPHIASALQAGIAVLVALAWLLGADVLVQGGTQVVPMQFNTAVCHLLAASSLALLLHGLRASSLLLLLPVATIAALTLVEEYLRADLGIDQLLLRHRLTSEGVPPGRMAPNTAIAFLAGTLAVLLASRAGVSSRRWAVVWACGFLISVTALIVIAGFLLDVPQARAWGAKTPMALLTSVAFAAYGLGLLFLGREQADREAHQSFWLPTLVFAGALVLALQLGFAVAHQRQQLARLADTARADGAQMALVEGVSRQIEALSRQAERLASFADDDRTRLFDADASSYLRDFPSISALIWTDLSARVQLIASDHPAAKEMLGRTLDINPQLHEALQGAQRSGYPRLSASLQLSSGDDGMALVLPGRARDASDVSGFLVAGLTSRQLFESALGPLAGDIVVRQGETELFRRGAPDVASAGEIRHVVFAGQRWTMHIGHESIAPIDRVGLVLLIGGVVAAVWLAMALRFAGLARARALQAEHARAELGRELREGEKARAALQDSERELASVLESITDAFYLLDDHWRFVFLNPKAELLMRREPGELLGRVVWDEFPEAAVGVIRDSFERAVREQITCVEQIHFAPLAAWFEFRAFPHRRGLAVYFHDISASKRAELRQRKTQMESERAQRLARLGSWEFDLRSGAMHWSDQACAMFGQPAGTQPDRVESLLRHVHPDDRAAVQQARQRVWSGSGDADIEYRVLRPDGERRQVHELSTLVRDDDGQPSVLAAAIQDVTEQRRADDALREASRRLEQATSMIRLVMDNSLDVICAIDANGRFAQVSAASMQMWGYPAAELLARPAFNLMAEADRERTAAQFAAVMAGTPTLDFRNRLRARDGREIDTQWSLVWSERDRLLIGVARDITERIRADAMEAGQRAVLAAIAARKPLAASLESIVRLYEHRYPQSICSVLLLDDAGVRVQPISAPSLPVEYSRAIDGAPIGEAAGSCGTAAWRGERVVVSDIEHDPLWVDFAALALAHGLRACWSTPIKSSQGKVLATFAVYYREIREPVPDELAVIDRLADVGAIAIEQAAAYRRLELSEQRFRSLFNEHPDAVYAMDLAGRFTAGNAGFERLTGRAVERALGEFFDVGFAADERDFVRSQFSAAARGEARTYETRAELPDGHSADLRVTNLPIVIDGEVTGVFGVAQDISLLRERERDLAATLQRAETGSEQLRRLSEAAILISGALASEALFDQLVELLRSTIGAHQALLMLESTTPGKEGAFAVSLSDKYAAFRDYRVPPDGSGIYRMVAQTNMPARMTQAELETHPRWRGFGPHAAEHPPMRGWLAVPLVGSDGRNLGTLQLTDKYVGEFNADDESIAVQFAQMASTAIERGILNDRLRARDRFFNLSQEYFCILDRDVRHFVQVNPAFLRLLGQPERVVLERPLIEFVHPEDRRATSAVAQRVSDDGLPLSQFVNRYLTADGGARWLEWATTTDESGVTYAVAHDISERRQAELALQRAFDDLRIRNRELQDFAFVASHDLQEPLRKIRAFSDRLQTRHAQQLDEQARDYLDRTAQAAARMQVLIDDLLSFSRVTSRGKAFTRVDLERTARGVVDDLEARIESSGGRVEIYPLPMLDGDATQMRQLLQNLVSNALKFRSPERAPLVRIEASAVLLDDGQLGVELRVIDNGIGFDPKYAERIFAPFQRLHGRHDYEGTGIGLAIVRRIVERHRGTVSAQGRPGEGATFIVRLPERQDELPGTSGADLPSFSP
jgi:PAS domain S-box-containing protein